MWIMKVFRTKESMQKFLDRNKNKIQWREVFINNAWAIEYRKLIIVQWKD
jgi:hypothetical protein